MIFSFFRSFRTYHSTAICMSRSCLTLSWGRSKSSQHEQVVCDNRTSHASGKPVPSRPGAPEEAEGTFEYGDVGFDTGPKVSEFFVNPHTSYHFRDRDPFSLRKGNVFYPHLLADPDIVLGGKASIAGNLPWRSSVDIFLSLHKGQEHGRIRGIAALDHTINNKARLSTRKEDLVPVDGLPVALLDNVGMALEQRNDLFARGDLFSVEHTASSLVHDTGKTIKRLFQFLHHYPGIGNVLRVRAFKGCKDTDCMKSVVAYVGREIKQILVTLLSYCILPAVVDREDPFLHRSAVIAESIGRGRKEPFPLDKKAGDDPDAILEQGGISRVVNIALYRRGIDAHRSPLFGAGFGRIAYERTVDGLPSLFAQGFDVLLQSRARWALCSLKPGKGAKDPRVGEVKGQL